MPARDPHDRTHDHPAHPSSSTPMPSQEQTTALAEERTGQPSLDRATRLDQEAADRVNRIAQDQAAALAKPGAHGRE